MVEMTVCNVIRFRSDKWLWNHHFMERCICGSRPPFSTLIITKFEAIQFTVNENVENYYVSIGFPPLPDSFYKNSIFEEGHLSKSVDCHASAHTMAYPRTDVRFKMCGKINQDTFYTVTHEMGHAYYYLLYGKQSYLFYNCKYNSIDMVLEMTWTEKFWLYTCFSDWKKNAIWKPSYA